MSKNPLSQEPSDGKKHNKSLKILPHGLQRQTRERKTQREGERKSENVRGREGGREGERERERERERGGDGYCTFFSRTSQH